MQYLVVNAISGDRTGLVYDLTRVVVDCTGNIVESRMSALGSEFAMLLLVSGNWHAIAKLAKALDRVRTHVIVVLDDEDHFLMLRLGQELRFLRRSLAGTGSGR